MYNKIDILPNIDKRALFSAIMSNTVIACQFINKVLDNAQISRLMPDDISSKAFSTYCGEYFAPDAVMKDENGKLYIIKLMVSEAMANGFKYEDDLTYLNLSESFRGEASLICERDIRVVLVCDYLLKADCPRLVEREMFKLVRLCAWTDKSKVDKDSESEDSGGAQVSRIKEGEPVDNSDKIAEIVDSRENKQEGTDKVVDEVVDEAVDEVANEAVIEESVGDKAAIDPSISEFLTFIHNPAEKYEFTSDFMRSVVYVTQQLVRFGESCIERSVFLANTTSSRMAIDTNSWKQVCNEEWTNAWDSFISNHRAIARDIEVCELCRETYRKQFKRRFKKRLESALSAQLGVRTNLELSKEFGFSLKHVKKLRRRYDRELSEQE